MDIKKTMQMCVVNMLPRNKDTVTHNDSVYYYNGLLRFIFRHDRLSISSDFMWFENKEYSYNDPGLLDVIRKDVANAVACYDDIVVRNIITAVNAGANPETINDIILTVNNTNVELAPKMVELVIWNRREFNDEAYVDDMIKSLNLELYHGVVIVPYLIHCHCVIYRLANFRRFEEEARNYLSDNDKTALRGYDLFVKQFIC